MRGEGQLQPLLQQQVHDAGGMLEHVPGTDEGERAVAGADPFGGGIGARGAQRVLGDGSGAFLRRADFFDAANADYETGSQGVGSAITYARRYAMCAMLGIASDDDDGEAAVNHGAGDRGKVPPQSYRQQAAPRSADRKPEPRGTAQRPPEAKNAVQRPPAAKTPEEESRLKLVSAAKHLLTGDAGLGLKNEEVAPFVRRVLGREDIGDGLKSMPVADLEKIVEAASESLKGRM